MRLTKNLGMLALAVYLILVGLAGIGVSFAGLATVAAVLAIVAGALILVGR